MIIDGPKSQKLVHTCYADVHFDTTWDNLGIFKIVNEKKRQTFLRMMHLWMQSQKYLKNLWKEKSFQGISEKQ